jgi:3-dehydroquinate synthase
MMSRLSQQSLNSQRGVALITVLLIVAIIVVIAANMTGRLQLLMSRSINMQASQQGMWSAIAGEQLVFNVLEQDFKDEGVRKRLNFGHTIGHAIESHSLHMNEENESLSHGVSVALGMLAESYISTKIAGLSVEENHELSLVIQRLLSSVDEDIPSIDELLPYLIKDKKNSGDEINFSLLNAIGKCKQDYTVSVDLIKESLDFVRNLK